MANALAAIKEAADAGRPGQDIPITIKTNIWACGCLPETLRRQIVAVETQLRIQRADMTPEVKRNCSEYRDQLCALHDAVLKAQRAAVRG